MKIVTYLCENCFEPYEFNPEDKREDFICPKCGEKMMYWSTEEIDPITKKVINTCDEIDRKVQNPGKPINPEFSHFTKPTPKCPTCGSTNIRKIGGVERGASIATFGIFSKKINKTFKCNHCGYTW